jgi:hypothetical protein
MDGITTKKDDERGSGLSDQIEIDEWRTRSHLALIIENIPSHWMVADLKAFLDGFGNVVKVVIFENREVLYFSNITIEDRLGKATDEAR